MIFSRPHLIGKIKSLPLWDLVVIGGGATGLGIAVDAASRGYATLLLEKHDFAKATSSRSTKLVHGGVRYLEQGNIQLVYSALRERGRLLHNAPHLVKKQSFIIPCYGTTDKIKYLTGLKIYDWLATRYSFGKSHLLNVSQVVRLLPGIVRKGLTGGVMYADGQFDDARLAINLAQTAIEKGAVALNYAEVTGLLKDGRQKTCGVIFRDRESGESYECNAKAVINATGIFVDEVLAMDEKEHTPLITVSQGIHLMFNKAVLPTSHALLIPKTPDGRVLFAVPWHDHVLVGTTDTPLQQRSEEPIPREDEIEFVRSTFERYLTQPVRASEIQSVFAGLRPLVKHRTAVKSTGELSRDHKIVVSHSGLISITGGKWTTYRKMAEDAVDTAVRVAGLATSPCLTADLPIHGSRDASEGEPFGVYGSDVVALKSLLQSNPQWNERLTASGPWVQGQVVWAVRQEMARTVEDVLARRLRILFLNAREAVVAAPKTAGIMAGELGLDAEWERLQVAQFNQLAQTYLMQ